MNIRAMEHQDKYPVIEISYDLIEPYTVEREGSTLKVYFKETIDWIVEKAPLNMRTAALARMLNTAYQNGLKERTI